MNRNPGHWTVDTIIRMEAAKQLRLQPDFQRFFIWNSKREQAFIDSLLRGYPIPPIWVWQRKMENERTVYDVIDGQQRMTCIKRFLDNQFKFKASPTPVADKAISDASGKYFDTDSSGGGQVLTNDLQNRILDYRIDYIAIDTDNRDLIIDVFRRLNKSSTNLTPQELRNAFYDGKFKSAVYKLTASLQSDAYWGKDRVFAASTTDRMGAQQFVSDLVVAMMEGKPQDRSAKLDDYYDLYDEKFTEEKKVLKRFRDTLKTVKKCLPGVSRFTKNLSDFYTLFLLVDELGNESDLSWTKENTESLAETLKAFEADYAMFLENRGKERTGYSLFEEYRETIVGRQREAEVRNRRREILRGLLEPGLVRVDQDEVRLFSEEQKDYIWQKSSDKMCALCQMEVEYEDYEPDHVVPWAKGGRTLVSNGQVTHQQCNRSKGQQD